MIYWTLAFFTIFALGLFAFYLGNKKSYTLVVAGQDGNIQKREYNGLGESIEAAKHLKWHHKNIKYGMVIHNITGDIRYHF